MKRFAPLFVGPALALALAAGCRFFPPPAETQPSEEPSMEETRRLAALAGRAAVTAARHPDADSVALFQWEETVYETNGTYATTWTSLDKILTERGLQEARTFSFGNDDFYGATTVLVARVWPADGGAPRDMDLATCLAEAIDTSSLDANIHNPNDKTFTLSFPGLAVGDTVEFSLRHTAKRPRVEGVYADYLTFEQKGPVLWQGVRITGPASLPLRARALRDPGPVRLHHAAVTNDCEGTISEEWIAENVPRYYPEPDMPPAYDCTARLLLSTAPDWAALSRWYDRLCAPRLAATNAAMKSKVDELLSTISTASTASTASTRAATIRAMFDFVSRDVRYMGAMAESEAPGYEPHDVALTFEKRSGVCRDKAALLVAMLRMAGIDAWPALVNVGPKKDPEVPQPYFNHAIVAADSGDPDDPYVLMDPTNESAASLLPEYLAEKSYLVARPEGETIRETPPLPARENLVRIETKAALGAGGTLEAESVVRFDGINDTTYRGFFASASKEKIRKFFARAVDRALPGAVLQRWALEPADLRGAPEVPLVARLRYAAPEAVPPTAAGEPVPLAVPFLSDTFGVANFLLGSLGLETRRFPLELEHTCGLDDRVEITLPEGAALASAADVLVETNGLAYSSTRVPPRLGDSALKNAAVFCRRLEFRQSTVSPAGYATLRAAQAERERAERVPALVSGLPPRADFGADVARVVATAAPPAPEDDTYVELSETMLDLRDWPASWTWTTHVREKVLTYAGQEAAADLEFTYFPETCDLTITNAFTIAADGSTNAVTALEEFDGDQSWVAAAPRYPAGRIRTVSFPAVTPGATIEYTVVRREHDLDHFALLNPLGSVGSFDRETFTLVPSTNAAAPAPCLFAPRYPQLSDRFPVAVATNADASVTWSVRGGGPGSAIATEPSMPGTGDMLPALFAADADAAARAAALREAMWRLSDPATQTNLAAVARAICPAETNLAAKVRAVRDWSFLSLRPAGPHYASLPLRFLSPADVTLAGRYGHALDRRIAELCLLRALGVEPDVLLFSAAWDPEPDARFGALGRPASFDSVALRVRDGDRTYYLDGASMYARLGACVHAGRRCLDAARPEAGLFVCGPARDEPLLGTRGERRLVVGVAEDGSADVVLTDAHLGAAFDGYNRKYSRILPEERRRDALERAAAFVQGAVLRGEPTADLDEAGPGDEALRLRIPNFAQKVGSNLVLRLPQLALPLAPELAPRRFPFVRAAGAADETELALVPPPGWRVASAPARFSLAPDPGLGLARRDRTPLWTDASAHEPHSVPNFSLHERRTLDPAVVPPESFPDYVRESLRTRGPAADTIVLEHAAPSPANRPSRRPDSELLGAWASRPRRLYEVGPLKTRNSADGGYSR